MQALAYIKLLPQRKVKAAADAEEGVLHVHIAATPRKTKTKRKTELRAGEIPPVLYIADTLKRESMQNKVDIKTVQRNKIKIKLVTANYLTMPNSACIIADVTEEILR